MKVLASALMLMLCMPKATENPNFPQSLSHKCKHQAKINLMLGHSQVQRPVIDVEKCPCMEYWNAMEYGKVFRSSARSLNAVTTEEEENFFLGAVDGRKNPWTVQLQVRQKEVCFKIDTGADVIALPAKVYHDITGGIR